MDNELPACCYAELDDPPAKRLYAAYNAAGERPGLNFQDDPCPLWEDLPRDVQRKWEGVARLMIEGG